MKILIIGSRNYPDLRAVGDYVMCLPEDTVVVSGAAPGVDRAATAAARARGLEAIDVPAKWRRSDGSLDRRAGFVRNRVAVKMVDRVVAFWDGKSRGTRDTITVARAEGKPVEVIRYFPGLGSRVQP